ncbi:hypothetical protein F8M41_019825 [Gigaspora margarita]|uniref:Uncharacterized protein n=1 Tax=Gigaspora margarita TaxID=4874 RepID=A0A8H4AJD4_GIGMA|nr:hypothetical protein F8M41_019825 [Gigaspora margarita]
MMIYKIKPGSARTFYVDLVRNRNSKITCGLEDSDETVFISSSDSEKDNAANQIISPICSDNKWTSITSITQISAELSRSVEEQLDFYLDFDIKKIQASFKSYKKTTPFTDVDEYTAW